MKKPGYITVQCMSCREKRRGVLGHKGQYWVEVCNCTKKGGQSDNYSKKIHEAYNGKVKD